MQLLTYEKNHQLFFRFTEQRHTPHKTDTESFDKLQDNEVCCSLKVGVKPTAFMDIFPQKAEEYTADALCQTPTKQVLLPGVRNG